MAETFMICASVAVTLILIFGFILTLRYLNYRETLALAEKGLVRPEKPRRDGKDTLRWGIIIASLGLALSLGLWPIGAANNGAYYPLGLGPWMLFGFVPLFFGLALVLIYVLTYDKTPRE